jgi:hypothetical protein
MLRRARARLWEALLRYLTTPIPRSGAAAAESIESLAGVLCRGDVLLSQGNTRVSHLIKRVTGSPWSHVSMYVGPLDDGHDPRCIVEADIAAGVRSIRLSELDALNVRVLLPASLDSRKRSRLAEWVTSRIGSEYDHAHALQLGRRLLRLPLRREQVLHRRRRARRRASSAAASWSMRLRRSDSRSRRCARVRMPRRASNPPASPPVSSIALERHQRDLLAIGVELYELSSERIRHDGHLQVLLGSSIGRLHAKMALIDRRMVYVGSLNLDRRSANINTEIGVGIESAEIASMLYRAFRIEEAAGVYRVRLAADGTTLVWSVLDEEGREETLDHEPDASWWRRLRVRLLSLFVPEGQL